MPRVFAVYDYKSEAYMQPFSMETTGQAIRAFSDSVNDPKSVWHRHPKDFVLYELGSFDDRQGIFKNEGVAKLVVTAEQCKLDNGVKDPSQIELLEIGDDNGSA